MTTATLNITRPELLEFWYCGLREGYHHLKRKQIPVGSKLYICKYCPSSHIIPDVNDEDKMAKYAYEEYLMLLDHLNIDYPKYIPSVETEKIIIRSTN